MYTLTYLQATIITQCLITHITGIWTLRVMYTLMYYSDVAVSRKFYYTHHSDMDDPLYVHVEVSSGYICN